MHTQLAAQQIYFPANNSPAIKAPEFAAMHQYAGQQLTTGAQAEVYADHFIANHLKVIGGGKTYAQLSAEAIAQPADAKLAAQVNTVFKGETLRGLLLNAYAFGTMGMIAGIAAIAAFIAAAVMLILGGLGLMHARRTSPTTDILDGHPAHAPDPSTATRAKHPFPAATASPAPRLTVQLAHPHNHSKVPPRLVVPAGAGWPAPRPGHREGLRRACRWRPSGARLPPGGRWCGSRSSRISGGSAPARMSRATGSFPAVHQPQRPAAGEHGPDRLGPRPSRPRPSAPPQWMNSAIATYWQAAAAQT